MLAKTVEQSGWDWDERFPFVLFAYHASIQESTCESPFYLLYGRDPHLPTETMLTPPVNRQHVDLDGYIAKITTHMSAAWEMAKESVKQAQNKQKQQHDRHARPKEFQPSDRVFVYMPGAKRGKAYKFAWAFHGSCRVLEVVENGVVKPVDRPRAEPIRVAFDWVKVCPGFLPNESWPPFWTNKPNNKLSTIKLLTKAKTTPIISQPTASLPSGLGDFAHIQDEDALIINGTGRRNVWTLDCY